MSCSFFRCELRCALRAVPGFCHCDNWSARTDSCHAGGMLRGACSSHIARTRACPQAWDVTRQAVEESFEVYFVRYIHVKYSFGFFPTTI